MRWVLIALVSFLAVACMGGDDEGDSAEAAAKRQLENLGKGQTGRVWDELHPAHQALVSRDQYMRCAPSMSIDEVEVIETYQEPLAVAEVGTMDSTAITLRMTMGEQSQTLTLHVVDVDGKWLWVLGEDALEECRNI